MSQELQKRADTQMVLEAQVVEPQSNLLAIIARAASDPNVDVQKWQALLDMHQQMDRSQAERQFKEALAAIQAVAPRILRDGKIVVKGQLRSTFATYEAVDESLRPLMSEYGFSTRVTTTPVDAKNMMVTLIVSHRGGHTETATMPLPIDASEYRSGGQNVRSSVSFAKRCLLIDFFNIVTVGEDSDGAGGYINKEQLMTLETMLKDAGIEVARFLGFTKTKTLAEIPAAEFQRCVNAIQQRGKR